MLLATDGAKVTITGRDAARLEETRQAILKAGISATNVNSVVADVTTAEGQDLLISSTLDKFGKINILVSQNMMCLTLNSWFPDQQRRS